MKAFFCGFWKYACVPLMILAAALVLSLVSVIAGSQPSMQVSLWIKPVVAVVCILLGMFCLRKMEKKPLLISSVIACVLSLVIQLLALPAINGGLYAKIYEVLCVYTAPMFWATNPIVDWFGTSTGVLLAVILLMVLLPMVYAFSRVFAGKKAEAQ